LLQESDAIDHLNKAVGRVIGLRRDAEHDDVV
jgi:hypothetical protein